MSTSSALQPTAAGPVRVFVRIRPVLEKPEIELFSYSSTRPKVITIKDPLSSGRCEHTFEFTAVFGPELDQERVFQPVAGHIVDNALRGRCGSLMACGQTGSGKTYSIFGEGTAERRGLLPRALERLFTGLASRDRGGAKGLKEGVTVSFLEVYLDQIRDLMAPKDDEAERRRGLDVREGPDGRVQVPGLTMIAASNLEEVRDIVDRGLARRATGTTAANVRSSRSHTIFSVHLPARRTSVVRIEDPARPSATTPSASSSSSVTLSFVDLAGSERLAKSKAEGARFQEAVAINSSLTALGKVVLALSAEGPTARHVPYRDSKLTRILSASLSGAAQVSLLATLIPRVEDYDECLNTLSFADRCKNIACQPQVSYITDQQNSQKQIAELMVQVAELRALVLRQSIPAMAGQEGLALGQRQPDSVDLAIQEVLNATQATALTEGPDAFSSKGSIISGVGGSTAGDSIGGSHTGRSSVTFAGGSATSASEGRPGLAPGVQMLLGLQEERDRLARAKGFAERREKALRLEVGKLADIDIQREEEIVAMSDDREELEKRLTALQAEKKVTLETLGRKRSKELAELRLAVEQRLKDADKRLLHFHSDRLKGKKVFAEMQPQLQERQRRLTLELKQGLRLVKVQHEQQLLQLKAERDNHLAKLDAKASQLQEELKEARSRGPEMELRLQEELLSLYRQSTKLAKLIEDAEDGLYPVLRRGSVKEVLIPRGLRPDESTPESHPLLFEALAQAESKVSSLERAARRPLSSGRLRQRVAAATGLLDNIVAGGSAANLPTSVLTATLPVESTWDASSFAGGFVEEPSADKAERLLESLSDARLRALVCILIPKAVEVFCEPAQRLALKANMAVALDDEAMLHFLKELEARRESERAAYMGTVERSQELRSALESRRTNLSWHSSYAGSRCNSRPRTPLPTAAPSSSRPPTAPRSRPQTAASQRVLSAGRA